MERQTSGERGITIDINRIVEMIGLLECDQRRLKRLKIYLKKENGLVLRKQ